MKTNYLFPSSFKGTGATLFLLSGALGIASSKGFQFSFLESAYANSFGWTDGNLTDELALTGLILGLLFFGFSRQKIEDEQITKLRLESLQWAIYFNYLVLIVGILCVYMALLFCR